MREGDGIEGFETERQDLIPASCPCTTMDYWLRRKDTFLHNPKSAKPRPGLE